MTNHYVPGINTRLDTATSELETIAIIYAKALAAEWDELQTLDLHTHPAAQELATNLTEHLQQTDHYPSYHIGAEPETEDWVNLAFTHPADETALEILTNWHQHHTRNIIKTHILQEKPCN